MHPPSRAQRADADSPLDVAYPVTFFDSTTSEASATPIMLEAGTRQEADISLHAVPALRLQIAAPRKERQSFSPRSEPWSSASRFPRKVGGGFDPVHTGVVEFSGIAPGPLSTPPGRSAADLRTRCRLEPGGRSQCRRARRHRDRNAAQHQRRAGAGERERGARSRRTGRPRAACRSTPARASSGSTRFRPGIWNLSAAAQGNALPVVAVSSAGAMTAGNQITVKDRAVSVVATVSPSLSPGDGVCAHRRKGGRRSHDRAGARASPRPTGPWSRRDQSDSDGSFVAARRARRAIHRHRHRRWLEARLDRPGQTLARYLPRGVSVTVSDQSGGEVRLARAGSGAVNSGARFGGAQGQGALEPDTSYRETIVYEGT